MDCIKCGAKTMVTNTRKSKLKGIRRTRECTMCNETFLTTELSDHELSEFKVPIVDIVPLVDILKKGQSNV